MISISVAGLVICLYAGFALHESGKRIQDYFYYANNCLEEIEELRKIGVSKEGEKKEKWHQLLIVRQLLFVVLLFAIAFIAILPSGLVIIGAHSGNDVVIQLLQDLPA